MLNPETGQVEDVIPMADWNVTGAGKLEGLPLWNPYQENDFLASFAVYMTDTITQHTTVGVATLDLKQANPELQVVELQPYEAEWWTAHGAVSAKTQKAYLGWDKLWKMDIRHVRWKRSGSSTPTASSVLFSIPTGPKSTAAETGARCPCLTPTRSGPSRRLI